MSAPHWQRFVAIGDSFTEGMSDPAPEPDAYLGWADRLASRMAERNAAAGLEFGYANLAIRGRLIADVAGPQTEAALALSPDLVAIVGGANDCLRPHVDLDAVADQLESAVARIRATGSDVLMSTTADPGWAPLMKAARPRLAVHTANVWGIAQRHGATVIDMWTLRALQHVDMWAVDRLHLTTEGHRRVAAQAAWALGLDVTQDWRAPLPPAPSLSRSESARGHAAWAREYLGPWVQRRVQGRSSGDDLDAKRPTLGPVPPQQD
ncbi:SGNH/GDSL hydrolase family protein [Dermacoccaceae bacterium W4C1]